MAWLNPPSRSLLAWPLVVLAGVACSGRELVLGGDPNALSATAGDGGTATAGASAGTPIGGASGSGASSSAGVSGTAGAGGTIYVSTGGSGGIAGMGGASIVVGGTANDPYPPVTYAEGQGYRTNCPSYEDVWGFTCWNHEDDVSTTCALDGTPPCNVCSCAVPCGPRKECPDGKNGEIAECVGSATTVESCFIVCDETDCPLGMVCSDYPGTAAHVCMWMDQDAGQTPPL